MTKHALACQTVCMWVCAQTRAHKHTHAHAHAFTLLNTHAHCNTRIHIHIRALTHNRLQARYPCYPIRSWREAAFRDPSKHVAKPSMHTRNWHHFYVRVPSSSEKSDPCLASVANSLPYRVAVLSSQCLPPSWECHNPPRSFPCLLVMANTSCKSKYINRHIHGRTNNHRHRHKHLCTRKDPGANVRSACSPGHSFNRGSSRWECSPCLLYQPTADPSQDCL